MPIIRRAKPIDVVEARRLYEQTNLPVDHIAALHGIGRNAFYRRVHLWGWRMRKPMLPRHDPPRQPDELPPGEAASDAAASDVAAISARIRRAVEHELDAIEQIMARLTPRDGRSEEAERAARVLASLTRTLHEVARLDATPAAARSEENNDRGPADPDEFIRDLARRMDEFARAAAGSVPDVAPAKSA